MHAIWIITIIKSKEKSWNSQLVDTDDQNKLDYNNIFNLRNGKS